jgi:type IV secretory pathway protease TraF
VFLLNRQAPNSLDGRYFGPVPARQVIGGARPLWTWEARR